jgi:hypothetical protein
LIGWAPVALLAVAVTAAGATPGAGAAKPPKNGLRVFKPVADAYVTAARPRANFGMSPVLLVDGAPETTAFLRFDLDRIRGQIASVTLLLHPGKAGSTSFAVRRVTEDEWRERRVTYVNAPQLSRRYASSRPVRRGVWNAVDVTSFVEYGNGEEVSLAITTRGTRALSFGSRESRHGPRLVVRTHDDEDRDQVVDALLAL